MGYHSRAAAVSFHAAERILGGSDHGPVEPGGSGSQLIWVLIAMLSAKLAQLLWVHTTNRVTVFILGWLGETLDQWNLGINESCLSVMIWWLAASEFNRLTEWPNCGLGISGGVVEVSLHLLERRQVGEVATLSVRGLDWCELNLSSGTYS